MLPDTLGRRPVNLNNFSALSFRLGTIESEPNADD